MAIEFKTNTDARERLLRQIEEQKREIEENRRNGYDAARALDDFVLRTFNFDALLRVANQQEEDDEEQSGWEPD